VKHSTNLLIEASSDVVGNVLADLGTYPHWNDLVQAAELTSGTANTENSPSWKTTLRAQVGPLARSKQLRFVRTVDETDAAAVRTIRFVRQELDGREHAAWVMETVIEPDGTTSSHVTLGLSYSGGLWMPALGNVLGGAIERATAKLPAYVASLS